MCWTTQVFSQSGFVTEASTAPTLASQAVAHGSRLQGVQLTHRLEQHRQAAAMEAAEARSDGSDADATGLLATTGPPTSPTFGDVDILGAKKSASELKVPSLVVVLLLLDMLVVAVARYLESLLCWPFLTLL